MVLVDTNIFIEIYRGRLSFFHQLQTIGLSNILVSHVTVAELYFGARNGKELKIIEKDLNQFESVPISTEISEKAVLLVKEYALSHNLSLPDALIAATALQEGASLLTLNIKDFRFIPQIDFSPLTQM